MPTISFLGTGSGVPSADRFFSSAVLHLGGRHLLVDAGEPCVHSLRERGDLLREIDVVLVTHGHVDHVGGLPALLQGCKLLARTAPLAVFLPGEMIAPFRAWIAALYLTEEGLGFPVSWNEWVPSVPVELDGGITVTPHPNSHLKRCYQGTPGADASRPCASYSLEMSLEGFRALFSGDLGEASEIVPLVALPADLLVCELSHFTAEELAGALRDARLHALCLVHLSEEYAANRGELQARMEELLPAVGDVFLPEDGEVLDF